MMTLYVLEDESRPVPSDERPKKRRSLYLRRNHSHDSDLSAVQVICVSVAAPEHSLHERSASVLRYDPIGATRRETRRLTRRCGDRTAEDVRHRGHQIVREISPQHAGFHVVGHHPNLATVNVNCAMADGSLAPPLSSHSHCRRGSVGVWMTWWSTNRRAGKVSPGPLVRITELATTRGLRTLDLTSRPSRESALRLYESVGFVRRETNVLRFTPSPGL
ncbi:hypothetical protein SRABI44_02724 [Microbacterium foliorum]|nr:hypothetical protein SRABI44_02724 [Microbacterium foliorum]